MRVIKKIYLLTSLLTLMSLFCFVLTQRYQKRMESTPKLLENTTVAENAAVYKAKIRPNKKEERPRLQERGYIQLGGLLSMDDPAKAYALLLSQKDKMGAAEFESCQQEILFTWAEAEPEKITQFLRTLDSEKVINSAMQGIAHGWANSDLTKGFEFLNSSLMENASPELFNQCHSIIMHQYANHDVLAVAEIFESFEDKNFQVDIIYTITDKYADLNYADSLEWAASLESGFLRNLAMSHLLDKFEANRSDVLASVIQSYPKKFASEIIKNALDLVEKH